MWSKQSLDVSVCVDCVEVKGVGETAVVRGNRATQLKLRADTEKNLMVAA